MVSEASVTCQPLRAQVRIKSGGLYRGARAVPGQRGGAITDRRVCTLYLSHACMATPLAAATSSELSESSRSLSDSDRNDGSTDGSSGSSLSSASKRPWLSHSKTRFNILWSKNHPCIVCVDNAPGKAYSTVCSKPSVYAIRGIGMWNDT